MLVNDTEINEPSGSHKLVKANHRYKNEKPLHCMKPLHCILKTVTLHENRYIAYWNRYTYNIKKPKL